MICGHSGSGKSTLANLIGGIDEPSEGDVIVNGKKINYKDKKTLNKYRKNNVGLVFQSYNLLEEETSLFNVMLPSLINGENVKDSKSKAVEALITLGLEDKKDQICKTLSGGEKQRIGILRALANDPPIIIADEPTGALDENNATSVMEIFKTISKDRLVIVITHNEEIIEKYGENIVYLQDGEIKKNTIRINKYSKVNSDYIDKKTKNNIYWQNELIKSNYKKRFKRNLFSLISISFCLIISLLSFGFYYGSGAAIKDYSTKVLNRRSFEISARKKEKIEGSPLSLISLNRPSEEEISSLLKNVNYQYGLTLSSLIPPSININGKDVSFSPIDKLTIEEKGKYHLNNDIYNTKGIFINSAFYFDNQDLKSVNISISSTINYFTASNKMPYIEENFILEYAAPIFGVAEELEFLNTPKIYYSYDFLVGVLKEANCKNISNFLNEKVSFYDVLQAASPTDDISSYSANIFVTSEKEVSKIQEIFSSDTVKENYELNSLSFMIEDTLSELCVVVYIALSLFLIIAFIGTFLLIGIASYSSYIEKKKESAILSSLGADNDSISYIYIMECMFNSLLASLSSILLSMLFEKLLNYLLTIRFDIPSLFAIPYLSFQGIPFGLIIIIILLTLLLASLSAYIPLIIYKKEMPCKELQEE